MDWIILLQNLIESFVISVLSCSFVEVKKSKVYQYIILFTLSFSFCISVLNYYIFYEGFLSIIYSLLFLGFMWLFKSETIEQPLQNLLIYILFWNIIESISSEIAILIFTISAEMDIIQLFSSTYAQMLFYIAKPIMVLLMLTVNKITKKYKCFKSSFAGYFVIIFLLLYCVITINESFIAENISIFKILIFINLLLFAIAISSFYIFNQSAYLTFMSMENSKIEQQIKTIQQNRQIYLEDEKRIKSLKHDLKNQFAILKEYLNLGEIEQCRKVLENSLHTLETTSVAVATGYPAIDAILTGKISYAKNLDIMVFSAIGLHSIDEEMDYYIALLLGNLFDNAIENIATEQKRIRLNIQQSVDIITIQMSNTTDSISDSLTTKKANPESHGFGISNIKKTVKKYNGIAEFSLSEGIFTSLIQLHCN